VVQQQIPNLIALLSLLEKHQKI